MPVYFSCLLKHIQRVKLVIVTIHIWAASVLCNVKFLLHFIQRFDALALDNEQQVSDMPPQARNDFELRHFAAPLDFGRGPQIDSASASVIVPLSAQFQTCFALMRWLSYIDLMKRYMAITSLPLKRQA